MNYVYKYAWRSFNLLSSCTTLEVNCSTRKKRVIGHPYKEHYYIFIYNTKSSSEVGLNFELV